MEEVLVSPVLQNRVRLSESCPLMSLFWSDPVGVDKPQHEEQSTDERRSSFASHASR